MSDELDERIEEAIKHEEERLKRLRNKIKNTQKEIIYSIKNLARLKGEKVFVSTSTYEVDYTDYYIAKSENEIEHADCEFSVDVYFGDGEFHDNNIRELQQNEDIVELEY